MCIIEPLKIFDIFEAQIYEILMVWFYLFIFCLLICQNLHFFLIQIVEQCLTEGLTKPIYNAYHRVFENLLFF